jgi:hypothetical protein
MRGAALAALVVVGGIGVGSARAQSIADGQTAASAPLAGSDVLAAAAPTQGAPLPALAATDSSASAPVADNSNEAQGNVADLQKLMQGNELTELRTSYNGSYGASLMLDSNALTYYVVLFQQKNLWRVIKTQDDARAEAIYADFARRTVQLADVEVRRTKLAAQKAYTDRLIALSQARADRLQADLDVAHQQQTIAATRQKEAHDQATALEQQKRAAQGQLRDVRRQVQLLERETELGLPRYVH